MTNVYSDKREMMTTVAGDKQSDLLCVRGRLMIMEQIRVCEKSASRTPDCLLVRNGGDTVTYLHPRSHDLLNEG